MFYYDEEELLQYPFQYFDWQYLDVDGGRPVTLWNWCTEYSIWGWAPLPELNT